MEWRALVVVFAGSLAASAAAQPPATDEPRMMEAPDPADAPTAVDAPERETDEERGVDLVLPIYRLAFGASFGVEPSARRGFTFDTVLGGRLTFQTLGASDRSENARWRPALTGEIGYSRRAGDYGTHDLTLGVGVGFQTLIVGLHLLEAITFPVDGSGRFGARTSLRVDVFLGLVHLEIGHEAGFVDGAVTHDVRGVIGIDLGLLISLFAFAGALAG